MKKAKETNEPVLYPTRTRAPFGGARKKKKQKKTLTTPISVVGDLCFNACFSQLEPKPPSAAIEKSKKKSKKSLKKIFPTSAPCFYRFLRIIYTHFENPF
jgi:hypothetical protein